ncbi:MAG TPA: molybdate ABC transporter permease subunit, partial [Xanthobacteraceae bacterium]|nr:molybdate ABC transporter permease subunit [Xanthobacteraceae bacterium]
MRVGVIRQNQSVIPGFGITFGLTVTALSLVVLIPLAALAFKAAGVGPAEFWRIATHPRTLAALRLSFGAAFLAAAVNAIFGLLVAWVL